MVAVAARARHRSPAFAACCVGARGRARDAPVRTVAAGHDVAGRFRQRASAPRADGTRALSGDHDVIGRFAFRGPRAATVATRRGANAPTPALLTPAQITSLGILLVAAQLPQAPYLPLWVAVLGVVLVLLRFGLLFRAAAAPLAWGKAAPAGTHAAGTMSRIAPWALVLIALAVAFLIRKSYGYFVGRDPCVAFLFVLIGIKFLEVRTLRDGTLLVCLGIFLSITPFFYSQSPMAGIAALPAVLAVGAALESLASADAAPLSVRGIRRAWLRTGTLIAQGLPIAAALFVLFPRLASPLWGLPADHSAASGLSDRMAPGSISELSLSDAVAFRVDFDGAPPPPIQRYWRGPVMSRFDGREWIASEARTPRAPRPAGRAIGYWVTLEPHWKSWLFALDLPADPPTAETGADAGPTTTVIGDLTGDQRIFARSAVTQPLRYRQTSIPADAYTAGRGDALENDRTE